MHACVVGGGIAGLYCAWRLREMGWSVTVWEKGDWGGRVRNAVVGGVVLNAGAGRFNASHTRLIALMKALGIDQKDWVQLDRKYTYVKDGVAVDFPCYELIRKAIRAGKTMPARVLKSMTMEMFMKRVLDASVVDDIIYAFGYNTEFEVMSAYEALQLFEHDFMSDVDYYTLAGGMGRIVEALKARLTGCLRVGEVTEVGKGYVVVGGTRVKCDRVFVCVTQSAFEKIRGAGTITGLGSSPLYRMYAEIEGGKMRGRVTTNGMLRYVIPVVPAKNIWMVSYSDGRFARMWGDMGGRAREHVSEELKRMFGVRRLRWFRGYYWEDGCHYWKPGVSNVEAAEGVSICGEMVSRKNHGWIEGALDTVESELAKM